MKKIFLLQIFIVFYLQYSYGQNSSVDSSTTNQIEKVHVGFYIMPASTFNLGNKIVPGFYDAADCFCRYEYSDIKEAERISYTAGFEMESIKIFKKISFST